MVLAGIAVGIGLGLFLAAIVWPTVALAWRTIGEGWGADSSVVPSVRQWGLLWHSTWMAATAACLATALAMPAAIALRSLEESRWRILAWCGVAASLLCPSTVLAFGWDRLLGPTRLDPSVRCMAMWSLWCWPLAALLISSRLAETRGRGAEAAMLETTRGRVFWHIVLPVLHRPIGVSLVLLFAVFFTDYGTPHACGLPVYATELLGWAASSPRIADTLFPALPSVGITLLAVCWMFKSIGTFGQPSGTNDSGVGSTSALHTRMKIVPATVLWITLIVISFLVPVGVLALRRDLSASLVAAWTTYRVDLFGTLVTGAIAGIGATWMGLCLVRLGAIGYVCVVWTLALGVLPGAIVGLSLFAAYGNPAFAVLFDHWPIVALAWVTRFGWVGALAGLVAARSVPNQLTEQAETDGASPLQGLLHVRIPMILPTLVGSTTIILALSTGDIAATSLVRVPGFNPISLVLLEKFHRFEDGMLVALSVWLVGVSMASAGVVAVILARSRRGARW